MTISNKRENEVKEDGMTSTTTTNHGNPLFHVKDEVDVDSMIFSDGVSPCTTTNDATTRASPSTFGTGISSIMESLSPKDLATLANLLKPLLISPNETKHKAESSDLEEFALHQSPTHEGTFSNEDKNKEEADKAKWHASFGESTYSLFYLCSVNSWAFWYAAFIYVLQITTILLTMIDVVDWGGNGLNLPPMVDLSVTIAQGVALFQAVAFQSDLIQVVMKFKDGFHPEVLDTHPGATYSTWLLSCLAQLFAGLLLLVTIFILVMQVDSVLDIMLNFAALEFMADIDDVAFTLAKSGFIGSSTQRAAYEVANLKIPKRTTTNRGFLHRSWKTGIFLMILSILLVGWLSIVALRSSGQYVCNTIIVNMGDGFVSSLGTFNGMYDLDFSGGFQLERRGRYVERRSIEIDTPGRGVFAYCDDIKAWTFQVELKDNNEEGDACSWIARSAETATFDIRETASIQWFVHDDTSHEVVLEPFSLSCFDCTREEEGSADCGGKGICTSAVCDCEDGLYGLRCEFVSPCPWITIDARTEKFATTRDWSTEYESIELSNGEVVESYHRPVYVHEYDGGKYDVVMFTGARWALTSSEFLLHGGRIPDRKLSNGQEGVGSDIGNFFKYFFHAYNGYYGNYTVAFLSDYMQVGTQLDSNSPVSLSWYNAVAKEASAENENQETGKLVDSEFLCRVCHDDSNPCLYDGKCNNGTCVCSQDSFGGRCEVPPVKNGHCDPLFNTPEFKLDGGDCCESTCVSTSQYVCGAEKDGYVSTGYFYCEQPKDEWQSSLLNGAFGSSSGFAVDFSMTSMVVSEPFGDSVQIYDKVGPSWILRETLIGSAWKVALSSGPFNVVSNPSFRAPLTIAVHDSNKTIHIYKCNHDGCKQTQDFPLISEFALSDGGAVLAMSFEEARKVIQVYEAQDGIFEFRANVSITRNEFFSEYIVVLAWDELSGDYATETEFRYESDKYRVYPLSLALNQDGTVLAYGFPTCQGTQLHIFTRNDAGVWVPRRAPQMNTTGCIETSLSTQENNALAVSGDGSVIAFRVGNKVRVYRWEAELKSWNSLGDEFPFTHYPVAMSPDGNELAIGSPQDRSGGVTAVYALPGKKKCPTGMSLLRLSLTLDSFPAFFGWNLVNNSTGEILFEQDSYPQEYKFATILEETCVPADSCYVFTIINHVTMGLDAPGQYALFMDGEKVAQGTFSGLFAREQFGNCASCPAGTELFRMMLLTSGPMEWALLKLIDQGANISVLHNDNNFDKFSNQTVDPLCSDFDNRVWDPDPVAHTYDACLDPTECYGVQVSSNKAIFRKLEIVFGEERVNTLLYDFCEVQTFFVGREDKCPQEED
ncbi:unknown protein [Seminavis robusta]|uniref:Uncharacterized protein n=1 Tax=Seminavis robusta TaxID=568900 RepID=A0A9N8HXP6_9STRA|nr:unknown protein [Seminavis robusta]|eukprot:Sro2530_g330420.1 n/a (1333) ;mRNA; f:1507-5913